MPPKRRRKILPRSTSRDTRERKNHWDVPLSTDDLPDAQTQREVIERLQPDEDDYQALYYEYAVCKYWHRTWQKYLGYEENKHPGQTIPPGPVQMNQDRNNNEFVKGHIWKQLLEWYGLDDYHELDRRYVGDDDEKSSQDKLFEISILRPISTNLQNYTKILDMKEYIGYIECQVRRIVNVPDYKQTRLWIGEKNNGGQFVMLKDRTEELWFAHGVADDKTYVIAVEIRGDDGIWPSGHPHVPTGGLEPFTEVTQGHKWTKQWKQEMAIEMNNFVESSLAQMKAYMERYLNGMHEREDTRIQELQHLKAQITKEKTVNEQWTAELEKRSQEIFEICRNVKNERITLQEGKSELLAKKEKFCDELRHVDELNKITEELITLNIGGHIFVTSTVTLTGDPDSMLGVMFSGRHRVNRTADGTVFIDRDGTHFRYILNYLRDGCLRPGTLPNDPNVIEELIVEAEYFQLQGLLDFLHGQTEGAEDSTQLDEEFKNLAGTFELYNWDD